MSSLYRTVDKIPQTSNLEPMKIWWNLFSCQPNECSTTLRLVLVISQPEIYA